MLCSLNPSAWLTIMNFASTEIALQQPEMWYPTVLKLQRTTPRSSGNPGRTMGGHGCTSSQREDTWIAVHSPQDEAGREDFINLQVQGSL